MSIRNKLLISLLFCTALLVLVPALFNYISFTRSLDHYLGDSHQERLEQLANHLGSYHAKRGDWEQLRQQRFWLVQALIDVDPEQTNQSLTRLPRHLTLLDAKQAYVAGYQTLKNAALIPIWQNETTVGWLAYPASSQLKGWQEKRFIEQQVRELIYIGLFAILLAALFSWLLARHLVIPIESLSRSTRQMAKGNYQSRNQLQRKDELGQLAEDINHLAFTLEQGRTSRERWLADMSHELRTPVTILQGEIQALLDGIRHPTPEHLASLSHEIAHLHKLLNDLHDLALADSGSMRYEMERLDLRDLLDDLFANALQRAQAQSLTLSLSMPDGTAPILIRGDETRLRQLLHNLFENSLKYTDANGSIQIRLSVSHKTIRLDIEDSAPGVNDEQLQQLFNHLYRVESSRNRKLGGSGIGLAICQRIAEAHQGTITASHSPLGGLRISLTLPQAS